MVGLGKIPDSDPMTSAAAVWFLYKLFSDLGIYYYFAGGKKEGEGRFLSAFQGVRDPSAGRGREG